MKQLNFILIFLMSFILTSQENIFFSEYAEGSSNNKYLEIYNNSDQAVDLTQYAFPNVSNDPTTVGEYEYWNTFDAGATIEPFGIYVIAHPSADGAILAEADMTFTYLSNGDDGFKLVYGTEDSFTVVDELGDWQGDPGSGWDVAGVPSGTKDHTLVRKSSVQNGNSWSVSAGTTAEDSEWIVYDQNTWTYLGSHEIESVQSSCTFTISLSDTYGDGWVGTGGNHTIDVLVGGTVVLDDITIDNGSAASYAFEVSDGEPIDVVFTDGGNWAGECGYTIYNNIGEAQVQQQGAGGGAGDAGPADTSALEAVCSDDCPPPQIYQWSMTSDGVEFDGTNQDAIIGYQIHYSTSDFTLGDDTVNVYEFDSFPHTMSGVLEGSTTYYMTIRSVCGDGVYSDWEQDPNNNGDGPDIYTTSSCLSSYPLPYLNDFNDPVAWTTCQTFYDNDGDGNYWFYQAIGDDTSDLSANSASYINGVGALTPDNWVIMGPIDLTNVSDALLEWQVMGLDPNWCQENYTIYVGSSSNYSDLINSSVSFNETITSGGDACGSWANRSLDISAASGELVYIGMRHHDVTDMYYLNIDNVSVTSSTMSNEDFTLQNIDYSFDQETNLLRVTSEEMLSNIQIYNMLGQEVLSQDLNETSALLNLSSLSSSIYIVNVEGNNSKTKTFKLAIK